MSRPRILIVDDEKHIISLLSMTLRRSGYEVLSADNGPRALDLAAAFELDLVIVDHSMPGMNGIDLAKRLGSRLPVIMVTARPELSEEEMQYIAEVVHKPFSPMHLVSRVQALVGPAGASKEQSA